MGPGRPVLQPRFSGTAEDPLEDAELKIAWCYDLNACRTPTGVTRHALAQFERLSARSDLAVRPVFGRVTIAEGAEFRRQSIAGLPVAELPLTFKNMLRWWRLVPYPAVELFSGPVDWIYAPAEFLLPARRARRAVTSHDILQDTQAGPKRLGLLNRTFAAADLVCSVSQFNTDRLLEQFPGCRDRVARVPNAAEDLFFEPAPDHERGAVRTDLGLPEDMPYLLSVANFQPRKNLVRLIRASGRLAEVRQGELALVLAGAGADREAIEIRETIATLGPRAIVKTPGYRQGPRLRAIYAEALALVFPSLCESFGIPAVEAMAQGAPVALADSTALPEIAENAGWYFNPTDESEIEGTIRALLADPSERARRAELGKAIAAKYRWEVSNNLLVAAMRRSS